MSLLQYVYTSAESGQDGATNSFMTFKYTPGLTAGEKDELPRWGSYLRPSGLPGQPSEEDIKRLFPVNYFYARLPGGREAIGQAGYVGDTHEDPPRTGNYIVHAFVLDGSEKWPTDFGPVAYFRSPAFLARLPREEIQSSTPPKPMEPVASLRELPIAHDVEERLRHLSVDPEQGAALSALIETYLSWSAGRPRPALVAADPLDILPWIAALWRALPENRRSSFSFQTYQGNPKGDTRGAVVGFLPTGTGYQPGDIWTRSRFAVFDPVAGKAPEGVVPGVFATYAAAALELPIKRHDIKEFHDFESICLNRDATDSLNHVSSLFQLMNGNMKMAVPEVFGRVWTSLPREERLKMAGKMMERLSEKDGDVSLAAYDFIAKVAGTEKDGALLREICTRFIAWCDQRQGNPGKAGVAEQEMLAWVGMPERRQVMSAILLDAQRLTLNLKEAESRFPAGAAEELRRVFSILEAIEPGGGLGSLSRPPLDEWLAHASWNALAGGFESLVEITKGKRGLEWLVWVESRPDITSTSYGHLATVISNTRLLSRFSASDVGRWNERISQSRKTSLETVMAWWRALVMTHKPIETALTLTFRGAKLRPADENAPERLLAELAETLSAAGGGDAFVRWLLSSAESVSPPGSPILRQIVDRWANSLPWNRPDSRLVNLLRRAEDLSCGNPKTTLLLRGWEVAENAGKGAALDFKSSLASMAPALSMLKSPDLETYLNWVFPIVLGGLNQSLDARNVRTMFSSVKTVGPNVYGRMLAIGLRSLGKRQHVVFAVVIQDILESRGGDAEAIGEILAEEYLRFRSDKEIASLSRCLKERCGSEQTMTAWKEWFSEMRRRYKRPGLIKRMWKRFFG